MSTNGVVVTKAGYQAFLAFAAGAALQYTHIAVGDANGTAYAPDENQAQLVHEVYRAPITSKTADAQGVLWFEFSIPANTPDTLGRPSHGFQVFEAGIYATLNGAPTLLAVARLGGGYKASPDSGRAEEAFIKIGLAGAPAGAVALTVTQATIVTVEKLARPAWITVDNMVAGAPVNPASGATYLVSTAPTGLFAGHANEVAQWSGTAWTFAVCPLGHIIADGSRDEADDLRYLKRTAGGWVSAKATTTAYGLTRRCTAAELETNGAGGMVTPADLAARIGAVLPTQANAEQLAAHADGHWVSPAQAVSLIAGLVPGMLPAGPAMQLVGYVIAMPVAADATAPADGLGLYHSRYNAGRLAGGATTGLSVWDATKPHLVVSCETISVLNAGGAPTSIAVTKMQLVRPGQRPTGPRDYAIFYELDGAAAAANPPTIA